MNPYLPVEPAADGDWRASALCAQTDPEAFFPAKNDREAWEPALSTCQRCTVRAACLEAALAEEAGASRIARYGMRGGLKPRQRWKYARTAA